MQKGKTSKFVPKLGRSRKLMGINFYYPYKLRPLSYGNESIGSACTHRATFSNTGLF